MKGQGKVLVCNLIIVLLAVASIITLCVGTFWKIDINFKMTKEDMKKYSDENKSKEEQSMNAAEDDEYSFKDVDFDWSLLPDDFAIELGAKLDIKGGDLLQAVGGNTQSVRNVIGRTMDDVVDRLEGQLDMLFEVAISAVVDKVLDTATDRFIEELLKRLGRDNMSEEEISQELYNEYGVTLDDIRSLKEDVKTAAKAFLKGDTQQVKKTIDGSDTFFKMLMITAKYELKDEHKAESGNEEEEYEPTDAQIEERAAKNKQTILDEYDEALQKFQDETGSVTKASILVGLFALIKAADESDSQQDDEEIKSTEDVKNYLMSKIDEALGEGTVDTLTKVLAYIGYFLIVVIAAWAYIILKIIIKLFMKNKTVGMFFPRFFGWMPHVFLVGIPQLLLKFFLNPAMIDKAGMEESQAQAITEILNMISINVSSLTWISALATVILLVIWFPYHRWRKQLKRGGGFSEE